MKASDVNLFDPAVQEDWYPAYDALQREAPVYQIPGTDIYVLTRYEDIRAALKDTQTFSNEHHKFTDNLLFKHPEAVKIYEEKGWPRFHYLSIDPPEQLKYRALIDPFFRGSGVRSIAPFVEQTCTQLIDQFADKGRVELVSAFAVPLPVTVITKMIGFPLADMPQLKIWSQAWARPFAAGLSLEDELDVAEKGVEFQHYIKSQIDEKRARPQEDILSALTRAELEDGTPLSDHEIMHIVDHLYIGGNETTTFALASGMWLLLSQEGLYEQLRGDPSHLTTFVEEVLRVESPTQGLYRVVTRDTQIGDVLLAKGATVHLRYGAANRDAAQFECPHQVDLERSNAKQHMAFSQGPHTCPGAGLSRLELGIAFDMLLSRLPNLKLADNNCFEHLPGFVLRALKDLHLEFDAGA
jgi:cytochrome P450